MTSPNRVADFYAEYDRHPGDRVRLFAAIANHLDAVQVLYPGSYVDIAPSVWFETVVYADLDRRAAKFFANEDQVQVLVNAKRAAVGHADPIADISFHHLDYREQLPLEDESTDLLISLYAGFISEHCTRYLRIGGHLLVNPSHGDAAMASINPSYELSAVVTARSGDYAVRTDGLDGYLVPKKPQAITRERLLELGRGIAYTKSPFAYLFQRVA